MQEPAPRRKLSQDDKQQILDLARQGWEVVAIARHLNINGQAVNGLVSTARKRGLIPPRSMQPDLLPPSPPETESLPMVDFPSPPAAPPAAAPAAPIVPPQMHSVPVSQLQPQGARDGGFTGGRQVVADSGGFMSPQSELRWTVERIVPSDGVLGTHIGPFSIDDLGQTYGGESTYRILRQEGGRTIEFIKKLGATYGQRKNPMNGAPTPAAAVPAPAVPQPSQRPFFQMGQDPMGGAGMMPFRPFPSYAQQAAPDQSVATEALRQMGEQNKKILEQQEKARQNGPDTFMVQLLQNQQDAWNRRWEEERKRDEAKRESDEEKYERRQKEERERAQREREASADAHTRELARIKVESDTRMAEMRMQAEEREKRNESERKFLLDLEDRRISVIKQEADINRKRLEAELTRSQEEMQNMTAKTAAELTETRAATRESIKASQEEMNERLGREREQLDRMHNLREKALEREHELQRDMLTMQRESIQKEGGDQLYNMLQTVFKEASKGFEKLIDFKKIQALTPEAQAAAVQRGAIDGNIGGGSAPAPASAAQAPRQGTHSSESEPTAQPRQAAAAAGQRPAGAPAAMGGQGGAAENSEAGGDRMLDLFRKGMETEDGRKFFSGVMEEWALHIDVGNDPSVFTTLFLEMLRDETNSEVRKSASFLFTLISARPWPKMYPIFKPYLPQGVIPVFEKPEAEQFYEAFRAMVYQQMRGYYRQLLTAAQQETAPAQAPAAAAPAPQAAAAPAPQEPAPAPAPAPAQAAAQAPREPEEPRFRTVS